MKPRKYSLICLSLFAGTLHAVNPVTCFYGGLILGVSYAPKITFTWDPTFLPDPVPGDLVQGVLGDIGGQLGFRFRHWRAEGELLYNYNSWKSLTLDGITLHGKSSSAPNPGYSMLGHTDTLAFMANGFYDFYWEGDCAFSPYVGVGIGYAAVHYLSKFYDKETYIAGANLSETTYSPAIQGIIGAGYFLDDYTRVGLDYRYFTTSADIAPFGARATIHSINLTVIGSFDKS